MQRQIEEKISEEEKIYIDLIRKELTDWFQNKDRISSEDPGPFKTPDEWISLMLENQKCIPHLSKIVSALQCWKKHCEVNRDLQLFQQCVGIFILDPEHAESHAKLIVYQDLYGNAFPEQHEPAEWNPAPYIFCEKEITKFLATHLLSRTTLEFELEREQIKQIVANSLREFEINKKAKETFLMALHPKESKTTPDKQSSIHKYFIEDPLYDHNKKNPLIREIFSFLNFGNIKPSETKTTDDIQNKKAIKRKEITTKTMDDIDVRPNKHRRLF